MNIRFSKQEKSEDILEIAALARTIWTEHYSAIIGKAQVDYMLDTYQSAEAIRNQIEKDGFTYEIIYGDNRPIGYIAYRKETTCLFLSKIYLLKALRGKGLGKQMLDYVESKGLALGCRSIYLTVNRHNQQAINYYLNTGFENDGVCITDIGNGFVMDDYKMTKRLIG